MASSIAVVFFILLLSLLSTTTSAHWKKHHHHGHQQNKNITIHNPLVFQACKKTPFYNLCIDTYASSNKSNTCKTYAELTTIAVQAAMEKTELTSSHINGFLHWFYAPVLQKCMSFCSKSYASVTKKLEIAMSELKKPNCKKVDVIMALTAAMSKVSLCEKTYTMQFEATKTLSSRNVEFMNLCGNAVAIAKLIPT